MQDIIQTQEVKTKSSNQSVEIFPAKKFFAKLHEHQVKKNANPHTNLCSFLCIDQKYKQFLMLKKLKRCIIDFNQSSYFQSIGLKKQKLPSEYEEYYDEEDPEQEAGGVMFIEQTNAQPPQVIEQEQAANAGEFEYYDEEDPEAEVQKQ